MPSRRALALVLLLAGCAERDVTEGPLRRPEDVRADIAQRLPARTADRAGWATDFYAAFAALGISPTPDNECAAIAIAEQESGLQADPAVPHLGEVAWAEIDRRAAQHSVPPLLVHAALHLGSPNGKSYAERIDSARTEKDLSDTFEDFIGEVPLGRTLFAGMNPVHTGGPMQVSVAFAERVAKDKGYPYPISHTVRDEVFTRRGGVYFGVAHLLGYPAPYDRMLYRFADFNAGHYASRNAAFQNAVSVASGIPLALDGDLVQPGGERGHVGATELAVRSLAARLRMSEHEIRSALEHGEDQPDFESSELYRKVFALAEQLEGRPLPRAMLPRITLESPKITRKLSTEWFAKRVDERFRQCLARGPRAQ